MLITEACDDWAGNRTLWHYTGRSHHCDLGDSGTIAVNAIMIGECVPFVLYLLTKLSVCQPRARSSSLLHCHAIIFTMCTIAWCIAQIVDPLRWWTGLWLTVFVGLSCFLSFALFAWCHMIGYIGSDTTWLHRHPYIGWTIACATPVVQLIISFIMVGVYETSDSNAVTDSVYFTWWHLVLTISFIGWLPLLIIIHLALRDSIAIMRHPVVSRNAATSGSRDGVRTTAVNVTAAPSPPSSSPLSSWHTSLRWCVPIATIIWIALIVIIYIWPSHVLTILRIWMLCWPPPLLYITCTLLRSSHAIVPVTSSPLSVMVHAHHVEHNGHTHGHGHDRHNGSNNGNGMTTVTASDSHRPDGNSMMIKVSPSPIDTSVLHEQTTGTPNHDQHNNNHHSHNNHGHGSGKHGATHDLPAPILEGATPVGTPSMSAAITPHHQHSPSAPPMLSSDAHGSIIHMSHTNVNPGNAAISASSTSPSRASDIGRRSVLNSQRSSLTGYEPRGGYAGSMDIGTQSITSPLGGYNSMSTPVSTSRAPLRVMLTSTGGRVHPMVHGTFPTSAPLPPTVPEPAS